VHCKHDTIDDYIIGCSLAVVPLLDELREFVHATKPEAAEDMQHGAPVFLNAHGIPVIYLFGSKKHMNFGFLKSMELSDPGGILKGSGEPSKHIRVLPGKPFNTAKLTKFVRQCASLGLGTDSPIWPTILNPEEKQ